MPDKYINWEEKAEYLKQYFEDSIKIHGCVKIVTVLDHVSESGMTRYITAFIPLLDTNGRPFNCIIARERKVGGCGMDMGFSFAYNLFMKVYGDNADRPYQKFLHQAWL